MFLQCLAYQLSVAGVWCKNHGHMLMWIKVHLAFSVVQVTNLCFPASHVHW